MPRVWKTTLADMEQGVWRSLEGRYINDRWTDGQHHPGPPSEVVRMTMTFIRTMRELHEKKETELEGDSNGGQS